MSFIVLGTDTDAGKTTFSLMWLKAHPEYAYWKPLETGDSDTERVRVLVPSARAFEPIARFRDPVAPPLAARREGRAIPSACEIVERLPIHPHLLIETFGGPFSPLNENELQIELIRRLGFPTILVSSSALGSIGRTLAMLEALRVHGIEPCGIVLMGDADDYALEQIEKHGGIAVIQLSAPKAWTIDGIGDASRAIRSDFPVVRSAGTGTANVLALDRQYVWHPYTSLQAADPPLPVIGAQAEFLHLADGRKIIDGISSWWTILHGHREPRLMAALHDAMQSFDHVLFAGVTHPYAVRVAELLLGTLESPEKAQSSQSPTLGYTPSALGPAPEGRRHAAQGEALRTLGLPRGQGWDSGGRVFFSDNGSTAVEVALKMAYQFWQQRGEPQRKLFVGFENGYHGDTFGAMAVGRDPLFFGRFEPLLFRVERVPVDANYLDDALKRNAGKVAAVIIEPLVQGAGGMRMHSPEELRDIYEVTKRHNVLFIADEVMTGCHRTGTMWAFQAAGIVPDLICTAKTLAGGILSLAATLVSPEVVAAFDNADPARTFFHGHSFTAHPLACAIAATNLEWLMHESPTAPVRFETFWNEALASLRELPHVKDVRIRGTIAAVEVDVAGGYLADAGRAMRLRCLEHGVFLRPLGNVLYALPPFGTSEESLEQIAGSMRDAVSHL